MSDLNIHELNWTTGRLAGWTYEKGVTKWFQGTHRNVHRLTRPCPTCQEIIVLDVTAKALRGEVMNHGLALRRCKKCREALKIGGQSYENRKITGAAPVMNMMKAASEGELLRLTEEVEKLTRMYACANEETKMQRELVKELDAEIATLRGKIATLRGNPVKLPWAT